MGLPNAGKSSLFNALASGDALVSTIPGTTRDYLTKQLDLGGVRVDLIDTAGWQDSTDTIEEQAQRLGRDQTTRADIILWCDEHGEFAGTDAARLANTGAEVIRVRTKVDLASGGRQPHEDNSTRGADAPRSRGVPIPSSVLELECTQTLRTALGDHVASLARPALAPSQSRCRHHVAVCLDHLRAAHDHVAKNDPPELAAAALRAALDQLGEMTGAIYTNDLLDRIFSRFCIGK